MTETALRRSDPGELRLGLVLVAAAAAAWALTAGRMDGMDAGPGADLGGLGWFAASWVVMMAAMMLPPLAPMVVSYERWAGPRRYRETRNAGVAGCWLDAASSENGSDGWRWRGLRPARGCHSRVRQAVLTEAVGISATSGDAAPSNENSGSTISR